MNKSNSNTLANKIAGVLSAAPTSFDPEDVALDDTSAKILENAEEGESEEELISKFRKQNVALLSDYDETYAGKKVSRKSITNFEDDVSEVESSEEDSESVHDEESEADDEEIDEDDDNSVEDDDEEIDEDDDNSVEDEDDDDDNDNLNDSSFDEEDFNDNSLIDEKQDSNFKHIRDTNTSDQLKKAQCVKNQMMMWENFLEIRIQLQKCLSTANKLPQKETFEEIKKESGQEFSNKVLETKNCLEDALDKFLLLQKLVIKRYPETKNLDKKENAARSVDEDDEEIPSDTEPEISDVEENEEEQRPKKKRKLNDYEHDISECHKKYTPYRNSVIQKWYDKTRLIHAKNNVTAYSVLDQIEYNLSNKDKLIKRTQLKRSQYDILGEKTSNDEKTEENKDDHEYNAEIFDDDDFYHQLLRELIEVKSADVTDPVQLSRQWIQLQNMRTKMKRKIDTKATKGRKIKYVVHNKLVNFMAPIDNIEWKDEAKTELFKSLFKKDSL